jgi:hypothetical protein
MLSIDMKALVIFGIVITTRKNIENSNITIDVHESINVFANEWMKQK